MLGNRSTISFTLPFTFDPNSHSPKVMKQNPNTKRSNIQKHFPSNSSGRVEGTNKGESKAVNLEIFLVWKAAMEGNYIVIKSSLNLNITKIWNLHWEIQIRITFPGIKYKPRHFASQKSTQLSPLNRLHWRVNFLNKISQGIYLKDEGEFSREGYICSRF